MVLGLAVVPSSCCVLFYSVHTSGLDEESSVETLRGTLKVSAAATVFLLSFSWVEISSDAVIFSLLLSCLLFSCSEIVASTQKKQLIQIIHMAKKAKARPLLYPFNLRPFESLNLFVKMSKTSTLLQIKYNPTVKNWMRPDTILPVYILCNPHGAGNILSTKVTINDLSPISESLVKTPAA